MRPQRLTRLHLLLIVPLTFLVFSARLIWTQEGPSPSKTSFQFASLAAQLVAAPEAKLCFHPVYENLSLNFAPNQGQTPSQVRFHSYDFAYHLFPTMRSALPEPWQLTKTDELPAKANHFIGNPSRGWHTEIIANNKVHFRTPDPGGDVAYYGQRIPWVGRIILSIGEKAKVHPRVFRALELIGPGLTFENRLPHGSVSNIHAIGRGPTQLTVAPLEHFSPATPVLNR
jgi:hypothetical protein